MNSLDRNLDAIHSAISEQVDVVEKMIQCAYQSLRERCRGTAKEVMEMEHHINRSEIEIEEKCLALLALQHPVASDLRKTAAALKINSELERIADLALNLAERAESLNEHPEIAIPAKLTDMVRCARAMLQDAKTSFLENDAELARKVHETDDKLDEMNREIIEEIAGSIASHPESAAVYLHVFSASRIVERMGDLATNIAEDVEYVVSGAISRHRHDSEPEHECP